jgi:hypothetical protein
MHPLDPIHKVPEKFRTVLRRDSNGYVVNMDGRVVGTLHQVGGLQV